MLALPSPVSPLSFFTQRNDSPVPFFRPLLTRQSRLVFPFWPLALPCRSFGFTSPFSQPSADAPHSEHIDSRSHPPHSRPRTLTRSSLTQNSALAQSRCHPPHDSWFRVLCFVLQGRAPHSRLSSLIASRLQASTNRLHATRNTHHQVARILPPLTRTAHHPRTARAAPPFESTSSLPQPRVDPPSLPSSSLHSSHPIIPSPLTSS